MENKIYDKHARIFEDHVITKTAGTYWKVQKPGTWIYGFYVTYSPGVLLVTGDLGELIVQHQCFTSPEEAANWLETASFSYAMSKSNAETEFDSDKTLAQLVEWMTEDPEAPCIDSIQLLQELVDSGYENEDDIEKTLASEFKDEFIRGLINSTKDAHIHEQEFYQAYSAAGVHIDDWFGSRSYPVSREMQYTALLTWGRLAFGASEEAEELKKTVDELTRERDTLKALNRELENSLRTLRKDYDSLLSSFGCEFGDTLDCVTSQVSLCEGCEILKTHGRISQKDIDEAEKVAEEEMRRQDEEDDVVEEDDSDVED